MSSLPAPTLRVLSLGAGVQSTTIALLIAEGALPPADAAIFADTGWEPRGVYEHLDRLAGVLDAAGVPLHRVTTGNLRSDVLNPAARFAGVPFYVLNADGSEGMGRRQCTGEYKVKPITRKVREMLGYPHPNRVPNGVFADQLIGISLDEVGRARDSDRRFLRNVYPLLDLRWTRKDCERFLERREWDVAKSACIGCPFHNNRAWREMRDTDPESWDDAVAFDAAIRRGNVRDGVGQLRGEAFLHRARVPLDEAPIDHVTRTEWRGRQGDLLDVIAGEEEPTGCSPFDCRTGEPAEADDEDVA